MDRKLRQLFNLRRDQDDPDIIDAEIRAGSEPVGANLWVLFFAILIASVGLNVNSTAVIIGAMLISPLMGPIIAVGYGAAVQDVSLIRHGMRALGLFTAISLVTSTLYFTLSPLDQPGSELLARTTPTLWDVLIAAFGGAAGMVAATRKDVSNVLPGVAIATALMPPLCTAGFGVAHARWDMFGGAFYLFVINSVFIAAATLAISKLLKLPLRGNVTPEARMRHRVFITVGIGAVLLPSVWLGYRFVHQEVFAQGVLRVAKQLRDDPALDVVAYQSDNAARTLHLVLLNARGEQKVREVATALLRNEGLSNVTLSLRHAGDAPVDVGALRNQFAQDFEGERIKTLRQADERVRALETKLAEFVAAPQRSALPDAAQLRDEVSAQFPSIRSLTLAYGTRSEGGAERSDEATVVVVDGTPRLSANQRAALRRWLQVRLEKPSVDVLEQIRK